MRCILSFVFLVFFFRFLDCVIESLVPKKQSHTGNTWNQIVKQGLQEVHSGDRAGAVRVRGCSGPMRRTADKLSRMGVCVTS